MDYRISPHAQEQMKNRKIASDTLDDLMQAPEQIVTGAKARKIYQSRITLRGKQFLLRAIVVERTTPPTVVSIYYTRNIDRYWQTP